MTHYAAVDAKRRIKKLNKIKGTVRQLYQNGQINEGEQLLDQTLSFIQQTSDIIKDSSDSDDSQDS